MSIVDGTDSVSVASTDTRWLRTRLHEDNAHYPVNEPGIGYGTRFPENESLWDRDSVCSVQISGFPPDGPMKYRQSNNQLISDD